MDLPYSQGSIKGGFPVRVFGSTNGRVYLADDTIVNDTTAAVQSYWDTIDFEVPQELQSVLGRWIEVELDAKGWEVDVYYSIDEGQSYVYVSSLALSSVWNKYRVPIDVSSKTLRIRLLNQCLNSTFYLRWLRVWVRPGGAS